MTVLDLSEELLPEVDSFDRVIGVKSRGEIHRLGLRHRSAHLLIVNSRGDFLLQKRSGNKDSCPGFWDSPVAGHVGVDESYEACIVRETEEELGVSLASAPEKLCKFEPTIETGMEFCQVFRTLHDGPFIPDRNEIEQLRWFSVQEIEAWLMDGASGMTPSLQAILAKLALL